MNIYLLFILVILIGTYFLGLVVDFLNLRHLKTDLPGEFVGYYDRGRYRTSQEYLRENTLFSMFTDTLMTAVTITFILLEGFNAIDRLARGFHLGSIPTGLIFFGLLLMMYHLMSLPFSIYGTFVIEEKYGFNRTTPKTFVLDILKTWGVIAVLGAILLSAVLWFFERTGALAWLYCWGIVVLFQLFLHYVAPVTIMPIFNRFTPLADGDLKRAIEAYARSQGFKMRGVFSMDGSRRSTKSNAFFTGFGRFRRIILFDTLIQRHSAEELVSILAHELGHYKKHHFLLSLVLSVLTTGLLFFILSLFINNRELFSAFKMEQVSIYASLLFFGFLYTPIEMLLSILGNALSRRQEYQADDFSVTTYRRPRSMIEALKKISTDNLSNLTPHPLKVLLSYSHPPVLERIRAIRNRARLENIHQS